MNSSIVRSFRESFEAVLIIVIILATLTRKNKQGLKPCVIIGILLSVVVSKIGHVAVFLYHLSTFLNGICRN